MSDTDSLVDNTETYGVYQDEVQYLYYDDRNNLVFDNEALSRGTVRRVNREVRQRERRRQREQDEEMDNQMEMLDRQFKSMKAVLELRKFQFKKKEKEERLKDLQITKDLLEAQSIYIDRNNGEKQTPTYGETLPEVANENLLRKP
tara:strand:+ start:2090 stop:2527 length:438 start_codon:yes stop_codon:yes gene_type:complete